MTPAESKEPSDSAKALAACILLVALFLQVPFEGWALSVLWAQNAVPLGAPGVGGWQMAGLVCLFAGAKLALFPSKGQATTPNVVESAGRSLAVMVILLVLVGISTVCT